VSFVGSCCFEAFCCSAFSKSSLELSAEGLDVDSALELGADDNALRSAVLITECGLIIYKQLTNRQSIATMERYPRYNSQVNMLVAFRLSNNFCFLSKR